MKIRSFILTVAMAAIVFVGCKNDDDVQPQLGAVSISVTDNSYAEGDGVIALTFTATTAFNSDIVIAYEVSGTATAAEDFEALSGSATLAAGETTFIQNITLLDDDDVETSEELVITITSIDGAQELIGSSNAVTLTITDNDSFAYENGILVLHEGNFGAGNASVSFVSDDLTSTENGIFKSVNEVDSWGDTAQSIAFEGDLAYIVLNNSQKIEVVNRFTFESVATIGGPDKTDFLNPRFMVIVNGKGYVTNWGDGSNPDDDFIAVINLENNTVESPISVAEGPEMIVANESTIYVAHKGGFNQNNIVSVIDATTNAVTTSITVADRPNSLQFDADGNLWALSGGNPSWTGIESPGQLDKIDITDNTVTETLTFETTEHPGALSLVDGSLYYYLSGSVFKLDATSTTLPTTAEITGLSFVNMSVNAGKLYGVDAKDYSSNGSLEVYDLSNNTLLTSEEVSIIPTAIYFNGAFEF
ncbi:hypothetical protein JQC67_15590 [Aurantibacter crassamenti]|uniref:DUF5074 domain-containing protein n=1 Tax=Aurantibacter crassamenti TaxID=1837375 RepID=UPI00193A6401|nr:DUF5074 domain-containing protein [Aurantibacter crassamenti]MBM1107578.1 hypothetical protein [Aurantibacter crassamenti]